MTVEAARDRSRDYIAFMECAAGDQWMPTLDAQLGSWLREKDFDVDLGVSDDHVLGRSRLSIRRAPLGQGVDLHVRLVEDAGSGGFWTTELVAHDEPGDQDWISLTVGNSQGSFVQVPRIARYLMDVLPLGDGNLEFAATPQFFGEADVDRLIELLADESRHGLVFVAGSASFNNLPLAPYLAKVEDWTRQVAGLAQVIVLDPAATEAFEQRVGSAFRAPAWTIRTYQPGVRFGEANDQSRHRILGTARLGQQSDQAIRSLLGEVARQQAATRPQDPALIRVARRFARLENGRLVEQVELVPDAPDQVELVPDAPPPPAPSTEPVPPAPVDADPDVADPRVVEAGFEEARFEEALGQVSLVQRVLGLKQITEQALKDVVARLRRRDPERAAVAALQQRVDELQLAVELAEDESASLLQELQDQQLETDVTQLDADALGARVRWLETRLKDQGDFESSYLAVPEEFEEGAPITFEELLDRIEATPGVCFTGDVAEVERVNAVDTNGAALRAAWDCVLALADYRRACLDGTATYGLVHYLANPPAGYRVVPPRKFAASESEATMNQFGDERIFPVPTHVHESGHMTMKSHFRLARIGRATPRMHVYDAYPSEEMVYIGYIGRHLTITQSN